MKYLFKSLLKLFILTLLFFNTVYCSTLNLSMTASPSRLNPILANDGASSEITQWLFNGLFTYDKNGQVKMDLAKKYQFISNTKLHITLRDDVKWHDGQEFTSQDVLFTYESIKNPKIYSTLLSEFSKVKSVKVIDKYNLEVIYKEAYFKALEVWMVGILPSHIYKNEKDMMTSTYNKKPIGTNSYKLSSFQSGKNITLTANDDYFEGRPKIDKILYSYIPDPSTSFLMLKQKQLDVASLTPLQLDRQLSSSFKKDFRIIEQPSKGYNYLGFNLTLQKFKDIRVRKALSLAINRQELIDIIYFGHGEIAHGPFLKGSFAFNNKIKSPEQNIEKAKKLLKSAGYDENNPLKFEVVTSTGSQTGLNTVQILQHQLKLAGVHMSIKVMEWQAFINTKIKAKNFEAVVLAWGLSLMPDAYSIWHSKSSMKGGFNFIGYNNKEVDALIELGAKTVDKDELSRIYKELFKHISEDVPYLFLAVPNTIKAANRNIQNIKPEFMGLFHNQKDWLKP